MNEGVSGLVNILAPHLVRDIPTPIDWEPSCTVRFDSGRTSTVPVTYKGWCSSSQTHRWVLRLTRSQSKAFHERRARLEPRVEHPGHIAWINQGLPPKETP